MKLYEYKWRGFQKGKKYNCDKAAGIVCVAKDTNRILVQFRSKYSSEPHTFGVVGGSAEKGEDFLETAKREFCEETGYDGEMTVTPVFLYEDDGFQYQNFIGVIEKEFHPVSFSKFSKETGFFKWCDIEELFGLPNKHFGLIEFLKDRNTQLKLKEVLK